MVSHLLLTYLLLTHLLLPYLLLTHLLLFSPAAAQPFCCPALLLLLP